MKHKQKTGIALIVATAIISGISIFVNSLGVKGFDSSVFTFSKNLLVGVLLFALLLGVGQWASLKRLRRKQWLQLGLVGLIGGSIPFLLFFKGLQMTTGTTSAFIHKTLFIYASVFALLFLKEKLSKGLLIGAALLLVGNVLLLRPDFGLSAGHLLILVATLFWAGENVLAKHILNKTTGSVVAFGRMFFGSLFLFLFLLLSGKAPLVTSMTSAQYLWIGVTSVFLLAYVSLFYTGLKHVKVSTATSILALGSPLTTLLGWVFAGNSIPWLSVLGMVLILLGVISIAGVALLNRQSWKQVKVSRHGRY